MICLFGWISHGEKNKLTKEEAQKLAESAADGHVIIPSGVTIIGRGAFSGNKSICRVTLPDDAVTIEAGAFSRCKYLRRVDLPDSIEYIGDHAFSRCTFLSQICIPENVTMIGAEVFSRCKHLQHIDLPDSVQSYRGRSFFPLLTSPEHQYTEQRNSNRRKSVLRMYSAVTCLYT